MINSYYPQDPIVGNITIQDNDWITVDTFNGTMYTEERLNINDLKNRIEKLEEGFRKIERKNEMEKRRRVYDLMGRIDELNRDGSSRRSY